MLKSEEKVITNTHIVKFFQLISKFIKLSEYKVKVKRKKVKAKCIFLNSL